MIYLDSAATTLQKPAGVHRAVQQAMRQAASPGRGGHPWGQEAARLAYSCREAAASLFHVPDPEQVVFTFNATHGLNLAIRSLVRPGMRVLISGYEHNAVTRPLHAVSDLEVRVAESPLFEWEGLLTAFQRELRRGVDVAICTHVSNVFGYILPIQEISQLCRKAGVPLILDASQSAGSLPLNMEELGADFIAMPGHKGLYGPQGTGLLLCGKKGLPLLYGGTGSQSLRQEMPEDLPDRLEAGTPNIPGIAGLREGIRFVERIGPDRIAAREQRLIRQLGEGLRRQGRGFVYLSRFPERQAGVLSFCRDGQDCEEMGQWLGQQGVAVRAGLHCAPQAHRSAGTLETGTIRASVSWFNTPEEICHTLRLLAGYPERK